MRNVARDLKKKLNEPEKILRALGLAYDRVGPALHEASGAESWRTEYLIPCPWVRHRAQGARARVFLGPDGTIGVLCRRCPGTTKRGRGRGGDVFSLIFAVRPGAFVDLLKVASRLAEGRAPW